MTEVYQDRATSRTYVDAREMVNDYLRRFGEQIRTPLQSLDDSGYTGVKRGSATVGINVIEDSGVILFLSRVMPIPAQRREALFQKVLALNFLSTSDAAFAIDEKASALCVRAMRRLSGLDYEEFEDLLGTVAAVADQWDDRLKKEFG